MMERLFTQSLSIIFIYDRLEAVKIDKTFSSEMKKNTLYQHKFTNSFDALFGGNVFL